MDRPIVHLPSVVARLGETEYPEAYGGLAVRLSDLRRPILGPIRTVGLLGQVISR